MCGQCGVYSTSFSTPEFDIFERLLLLNVFRGDDSTGVIRVSKDLKTRSRKSLLSSPDFISSASSDIIGPKFAPESPLALMGHCRAATKGAVTLKNAHPFGFSDVVGMHNGTIHKKFEGRGEFDTDSEGLYKLINDRGLKEALEEVNDWDTAYALQWINKTDKTLNFIRNKERPLYFTYIFNGQGLIWSSERIALEFVLSTKKLTNVGWKGDTKDRFFTLDPNDHMILKLGAPAMDAEVFHVDIPEKKVYTASGGKSGHTGWAGEWTRTSDGVYRLVKKEPPLLSPPKLTPARGTNSTTTKLTGGVIAKDTTPTKTDNVLVNQQTGEVLGESYGGFRDALGYEALKKLSWLQQPAPGVKGNKVPKGDLPKEFSVEDLFLDESLRNSADNIIPFEGPFREDDDGGTTFYRGHEGVRLTESELLQRLREGCFACSETLDLDSASDIDKINNIHWWSREHWACDYCFKHSDGDWVRCTIENDWDDPKEDVKEA